MRYTDAVNLLRNKNIDVLAYNGITFGPLNKTPTMIWLAVYDLDLDQKTTAFYPKDIRPPQKDNHVLLAPLSSAYTCRELICQQIISGKRTEHTASKPAPFFLSEQLRLYSHYGPGQVGLLYFKMRDSSWCNNLKNGMFLLHYLEDLAHSVHSRVYDATLHFNSPTYDFEKNQSINHARQYTDGQVLLIPAMWMRNVVTLSLYLLIVRLLILVGASKNKESIIENVYDTLAKFSVFSSVMNPTQANSDRNTMKSLNYTLEERGINIPFPIYYCSHYRQWVRGLHEDNNVFSNSHGVSYLVTCLESSRSGYSDIYIRDNYYGTEPAAYQFFLRIKAQMKADALKIKKEKDASPIKKALSTAA